jgi:metal-responsive CopG/Arc/MetJ family transcriptional regulator
MYMKRLNITLPEEIAQEIKDIPNKSGFISEAVKEKLERINKEKLDQLLIEGYKATRKEDKEINQEWEKITLEGWR